jgi:predicted RNA-binding protein with RPS1 domain
VEGTITNVTDFGIFVQLEEGVEGLVHVSEISKEKITTPVGMYNVGDTLTVKVINVSSKDRKIGLSIKALDDDSDTDSLQDYKKKQAAGPSTIGDLIKEEMESKETSSKTAAEEPAAEAAVEEPVTEETVAEEAAPEAETEEPSDADAAEEAKAEAGATEEQKPEAPGEEADTAETEQESAEEDKE